MQTTRPVLIFDGDCGFCTTTAMWTQRNLLPRDGRIVTVTPWQRTDLAALGVDPERVKREVVWVADDQQYGGAAAAAALLRYRGGPLGVLGRVAELPVIRAALGVLYRFVARHRHQFPGGTPACALPPR